MGPGRLQPIDVGGGVAWLPAGGRGGQHVWQQQHGGGRRPESQGPARGGGTAAAAGGGEGRVGPGRAGSGRGRREGAEEGLSRRLSSRRFVLRPSPSCPVPSRSSPRFVPQVPGAEGRPRAAAGRPVDEEVSSDSEPEGYGLRRGCVGGGAGAGAGAHTCLRSASLGRRRREAAEEEVEETPQEKKLRLAKLYLEQLRQYGESRPVPRWGGPGR